MNQTLINKFFLNECTDEEYELVLDYFRKNPEALSDFITEDNWNVFEPEQKWIAGKRVWADIESNTQTVEPVYATSKKTYWIAACIVLVCLCISALIVFNKTSNVDVIANKSGVKKDSVTVVTNHTNKEMHLLLPDSSVVALYANSELSYKENFEPNKRDVSLKGKALFKVFKDKSRPFSVYSGNTITTALGTIFWVDESKNNLVVKVHLFEGKVVIKKMQHDSIGDVLAYLTPGNEYVYNPSVNANNKKNSDTVKDKVADEKNTSTQQKVDTKFVFDKWPVSKVLDTLSASFNIQIHYSKDKLVNSTYTGTFNSVNTQMKDFLEELSMLNGWQLKQTGTSGFTIVPAARQ